MVLAEIGGAAGAGAVFDDADAIDVEAADDRPARGARREAGAGNAGLGEQEIAELGAALAADFLVRHDGDGCELIGHDRAARPAEARRAAGAGCGWLAPRSRLRPGAVRATRTGVRDGTTACRRTIGLGAVTVISGSCVRRSAQRRPGPLRCCHRAQQISQLASTEYGTPRSLISVANCHRPDPDCRRCATDRFRFILGGSATHDAAIPRGHQSIDVRRREARGTGTRARAEFRWANSASVVRYRSSIACGSNSSGGVANSTVVRQRDDGADRAGVSLLLVGIVVGRRLLLSGLAGRVGCGQAVGARPDRPASAWSLPARPPAWKCPNDSANWIASANSASREPCLMFDRNHFMR